MSLTKKDPSLRVAANDPHLVSLGGGRLSVAVTIHNIPIGDTTIGSSALCDITLNGTGVQPTHCTIYRSEENEVTLVPERDARILIDGNKINQEANLRQGAMITIGNSNYLRFNNPAEAELIRSAMGSNERISMPQIDFTQLPERNSAKSNGSGGRNSDLDHFYDNTINPLTVSMKNAPTVNGKAYNNLAPIDINGLQCPKVFTADLVTVNMPAKDVLGQKYASFAKNLVENHRNDKNAQYALRNNQRAAAANTQQNGVSNYVNIPSTSNFIQNTNSSSNNSGHGSGEYISKVQNTSSNSKQQHFNSVTAYDRYPKPGTYGGLQIYPMNGVNTDINNGSPQHQQQHQPKYVMDQRRQMPQLMNSCENECLEDMLKKCTEYADRQSQSSHQHHSSSGSITSSPIVQNRIKTNGSLPRDKKSPFYHESAGAQLQQSFNGSSGNLSGHKTQNGYTPNSSGTSSGYENVRLVGQQRVEIITSSPKTGYENVVLGKYVPQSPRTKIRTTCMSPKKEHSFSHAYGQAQPRAVVPPPPNPKPQHKQQNEYDQLIRTFEEKLMLEMQAIEESSRYQPTSNSSHSAEQTPAKRINKNINNLTLNLQQQSNSLQNSPRPSKKPTPAPRTFSKASISGCANSLQRIAAALQQAVAQDSASNNVINDDSNLDLDQLKQKRRELLTRVQSLKREISDLQKQEDEVLRELDMEKALVCAELNSVGQALSKFQNDLHLLQNKIHRLEAQRNATRVMEENQQAKLKQSIEMKQDQVKKLKDMLKDKPNNDCLKEELHNVCESLENDRKTFEDLEFQYLEEESEWHAYREELNAEEKGLALKIEEKQLELQHLEKQELANQSNACSDTKTLKQNLLSLHNELRACEQRLKVLEQNICDVTGQLRISSSSSEADVHDKSESPPLQGNLGAGVMSQSLFGSAELLCPKRSTDDIMSKSMNENMFYNNKIELPSGGAPLTSTPKRSQMQLVDIEDVELLDASEVANNATDIDQMDGLLRNDAKSEAERERIKFNLSLGSDDFEVNPLEKRVPSQDDIDRISKVTLDAPISTKGASNKIFDSIKEIERNRQLLLAQQGHHVIEHERQKMNDLKKKSHDEARAQYLLMLNESIGCSDKSAIEGAESAQPTQFKEMQKLNDESIRLTENKENQQESQQKQQQKPQKKSTQPQVTETKTPTTTEENSSQQRHSQPEFDTHTPPRPHSRSSPRPLSEANSELSCDDLLSSSSAHNVTNCKSNIEGGTQQQFNGDEMATKRSSTNSNETVSGGSNTGSGLGSGDRKRALAKHQRPLTRYLPIFSPDLNLRHHIESAGHQIALCPHVFVDAHSCRGYLHKLGATFHGWARRWFVLDRQRSAFIYYADKSERKPRGGAYFSTIDEVYLDHLNASKSGRPHCTLIVKTKKRSYHLQAASDAAARIWIDAIITGAQGNLDY